MLMIIAGLGNPGAEYANTRHNAGFWAADAIAARLRANFSPWKNHALVGELTLHGQVHLLIKPQTYMNLSGEAVAALMLENNVAPSELLVIVDDINLPTGRIRIRASGSDGGHNGLKSIINHIGKNWRLRICGDNRLAKSDSHDNLALYALLGIASRARNLSQSSARNAGYSCKLSVWVTRPDKV